MQFSVLLCQFHLSFTQVGCAHTCVSHLHDLLFEGGAVIFGGLMNQLLQLLLVFQYIVVLLSFLPGFLKKFRLCFKALNQTSGCSACVSRCLCVVSAYYLNGFLSSE